MKAFHYVFALSLFSLDLVTSRQHVLKLKNDNRNAILCSRFAYYAGGFLSTSLDHLDGDLSSTTFTLDKDGNSDVTSYIESKKGNCFRGDPSKFLYLSFDPSRSLLLVHNRDVRLQGLVFEAGAKNMDDDDGISSSPPPRTLTDRLKLILDLLNLSPAHSSELASEFGKLLQPLLPAQSDDRPIEQSTIYKLLRRLAKARLPPEMLDEMTRPDESPGHAAHSSNSVMSQVMIYNVSRDEVPLSREIDHTLSSIYLLTTPLGSLRAIPYQSVQGKPKVKLTVRFPNKSEEGLYSFYFHHCPLSDSTEASSVNLTIRMIEKNKGSYLSAGQEPLPLLYFIMCLIYLLASFIWLAYLRHSKNTKYRIHYLMFAVVIVKAISLAFHGINFYVIGRHGVHEEGWAVMYYITHIVRGALLFIAILLIGAGWAFFKHMLTPRERNVFLVVIPLQILANIATVVIEESEAGTERYALWKDIFIFVDLVCCGAILFPVVWSIRHLQAASQTDGKAAINLRNLRLFRHFYILVICYVYFTRVVAYLLTVTMSYSFAWVVELFKESITFLFFVSVGYKFRPISDNPYLLVPNDEDEEDTVMERIQLEDVWSQSGVTDGVFRTNRAHSHRTQKLLPSKTTSNVAARSRSDSHDRTAAIVSDPDV